MIVFERLDEIGPCPHCPRATWLFRDGGTGIIACGICTRDFFLTNIRGVMSTDDRNKTRELRFRHGRHHVIIIANADGSGSINILDDFYKQADPESAKEAVKDAVKMLSIARHIAWKEFMKLGGTVEELRDSDGD